MRFVGIFVATAALCACGEAWVSAPAGPTRTPRTLGTPGIAASGTRERADSAFQSQLSAAQPRGGDSAVVVAAPRGGGGGAVGVSEKLVPSKTEIGIYFVLWYLLNIGYNITNKRALSAIKLPWTISVTQLMVGSIMVVPMWLFKLRDAPGLSKNILFGLAPIGLCHMLTHLCAVIGLEAGAISFVHIVKAAEPLFTALFSAIFLKQIFSTTVYATLLPVVGGVGIACLKELEFKWLALYGAMGSNLAASTRAILSKRKMGMDMGKNMTPANMYGVLTIMASLMLLPLTAFMEGPTARTLWEATVTSNKLGREIMFNTVASGVCFYLYNEVAFRCLHAVHPVTHAVGNTFKRVFLIATSILVFKKPLTPMAAFGSAVAIGGVLMYSLMKEYGAKNAAAVKAHGSG